MALEESEYKTTTKRKETEGGKACQKHDSELSTISTSFPIYGSYIVKQQNYGLGWLFLIDLNVIFDSSSAEFLSIWVHNIRNWKTLTKYGVEHRREEKDPLERLRLRLSRSSSFESRWGKLCPGFVLGWIHWLSELQSSLMDWWI